MSDLLNDCLNVAVSPKFKALLKKVAFYERTSMSLLARKWLRQKVREWSEDAPSRIPFDIFLSLQEVEMLRTRGYQISGIDAEGCADSDPQALTPGLTS